MTPCQVRESKEHRVKLLDPDCQVLSPWLPFLHQFLGSRAQAATLGSGLPSQEQQCFNCHPMWLAWDLRDQVSERGSGVSEPHECVESGSRASVHWPGQTASAESREAEPQCPQPLTSKGLDCPLWFLGRLRATGTPTCHRHTWLSLYSTCHMLLLGRKLNPTPVTYR